MRQRLPPCREDICFVPRFCGRVAFAMPAPPAGGSRVGLGLPPC